MLRTAYSRALTLLALPAFALAQSGDGATKLAKATQNPVGDLVSIPFQFNYFTGGGLGGETLTSLNFQPVLPLAIGKRWNIIARTIVPYMNAPASNGTRTRGIGDIVQQAFLSKSTPDNPIWGIGPMFSFPTATNVAARTGDWGLGPAAVVLTMPGPWVLGALVTQVWTIADDGESDVNQFSVQPIVNYNLADGWAISFSPTITANWEATDEQWTVPLGLGVSKVTALGKQPMSIGILYYANVIRPPTAGSSQLRFTASFLYPKAK